MKLQLTAIHSACLLKRNFCYALFSGNFQSNRSSKFLLVADSESLDIKYSPSKIRKTSKDQKKFTWDLQMAALKKLKMFKKNVETLLQWLNLSITDIFSRNAPSAWTLLGQLPKQKHSPKVVLRKSCSRKFPDFRRIEPLMKSFLS